MGPYRCLMLGAGHSPLERKIAPEGTPPPYKIRWTSLDFNEKAKPDHVFDLDQLRVGECLPFEDERFSEIHAYEVLEHVGLQGDFRGFFAEFREYWRVLRPGGLLIGTVPAKGSDWDWDDPGHTRVITGRTLSFLTRELYSDLGKNAASDYGEYVDPCWWSLVLNDYPGSGIYIFGLQKT